MSKQFTYGIKECIDELSSVSELCLCLQDSHELQQNKYPVALTQVIMEKVEDVLSELVNHSQPIKKVSKPGGFKSQKKELKKNAARKRK